MPVLDIPDGQCDGSFNTKFQKRPVLIDPFSAHKRDSRAKLEQDLA